MAVNNYISEYMPGDLPWYERDVLMTDLGKLKRDEFLKNPDKHFREKKIINFSIIYKSICGEKISEIDLKNYERIKDERVREYPRITLKAIRGKTLKLQQRKCLQDFIQFINLLIVY